ETGQIIIVDVENWDEETSPDDQARFVFRGEGKPVDVPDAPPVDIAATGGEGGGSGSGSSEAESE
ncbi:hypothetical protein, partial [Haloechinothrix salitolerans]